MDDGRQRGALVVALLWALTKRDAEELWRMALTVVGDSEAPRWLVLPWALSKGDADELTSLAWRM